MDFDPLFEKLHARFPEVSAPAVENGERFVLLPEAASLEILRWLKEDPDLSFDNLMMLAGVDTGREFWVVYALHSFKQRHRLLAKVVLSRAAPEIESVTGLWSAANYFEREAYDLYGIVFKHHPDLRRLLNPPDWEGWPGRKDYQYPKEYHGVKVERPQQFFDEQVEAANASRTGVPPVQSVPPNQKPGV